MGNPIEKLSTAPSMPQTKEYLVPQATTGVMGRKVEWMRQSSFIREGIRLNSGKMRATLDLVEKRVLEEDPISIDELQAHKKHLTELKGRVISHIREGGAGRWFKNTKINNVSKKFDAIFGKLHEKKCQVLRDANKKEFIKACSLFSPEDVNLVDSMGKTALHYAVEKGYLDAVQILLEKGANAGVQDGQGNSPIFFAVAGSKPIFDALLEKMTPDQLKKKNKKGETVFLRGVQNFSEDRCKAIIGRDESAALQSVDKKGNTPWHYLAMGMSGLQGEAVHRWLTLFSTMPETVKQVWSQKNAEGCTAVQMAAKHKNLAFLGEAFSPFRTDPNTDERTPQTNDMQGSKNPLPFLIDHFNNIVDDEEGKRIGLMIYFLAATHPELFQGKEGARLRTSIAEMGERGISLPPEILYCSEHPYEVQKLVEEKKSEIQGELKKLGDEIASIPNNSKEEKDQALNRINERITPPSVRGPKGIKIDQSLEQLAQLDGNDPQNADLIYERVGKAQGSVITTKNAQGLTPIHIAIQAGNWVFMNAICGPTSRYLILQESDLPKLKTPDGKSILQFAIEAYASVSQEKKVGVNEAIKYLLMEHPSLASQIDKTTLQNLPEETQELLSDPGKARLLSIVTKSGANFLHLEGSRVIARASSTATEATVLRVHSNP